jgi:hypothetical protein
MQRNWIKVIVQDYGWVHLSLTLLGNLAFIFGSLFFFPILEEYKIWGVWLFVIGSTLMFFGSLGRLLVDLWDQRTSRSRYDNSCADNGQKWERRPI